MNKIKRFELFYKLIEDEIKYYPDACDILKYYDSDDLLFQGVINFYAHCVLELERLDFFSHELVTTLLKSNIHDLVNEFHKFCLKSKNDSKVIEPMLNKIEKNEKLLFYCTKAKPYLYYDDIQEKWMIADELGQCDYDFNGKIVAMCDCKLVEDFTTDYRMNRDKTMHIAKDSCLSFNDLVNYEERNNKSPCLYGLHLSNIEILDEPEELSKYGLKKAPQNMCNAYDKDGEKYILLSIHSSPLLDILCGLKTIEVRRRILKDLKELIK